MSPIRTAIAITVALISCVQVYTSDIDKAGEFGLGSRDRNRFAGPKVRRRQDRCA